MNEALCKGCARKMIWATNPATGKMIPLDAVATIYKLEDGKAIKVEGYYVSHFATCKYASEFSFWDYNARKLRYCRR